MSNALNCGIAHFDKKVTNYQLYVDKLLQEQEQKIKEQNKIIESLKNLEVKPFSKIDEFTNVKQTYTIGFQNGAKEIYVVTTQNPGSGAMINIEGYFADGDKVMFQYASTNNSTHYYFQNVDGLLRLFVYEFNYGVGIVHNMLPMFISADGMNMSEKTFINNNHLIQALNFSYTGTMGGTVYAR